jgi:hypothetical protein
LSQAIYPVRKRCCGGLVDETRDLDVCDATRIFRRTSLVVIKVGRDGDHRFLNRLAEEGLRILFDFLQ